jgi:phosphoribosylformylglycinamidine synthase
LDALQAATNTTIARDNSPEGLASQVREVLAAPNLQSAQWVTNQYDYYVLGNTAMATPDDAGMIRVDEETGLGVALSTDSTSRYSHLDPYAGAQQALAEAFRNVACTGAKPLAVSDCLNFGSPEDPEVMWQFAQSVTGLADGCMELGIPVTGGNVSLYNQTGDTPIYPTPVVAVMGVIDNVARRLPSGWQDDGENIYLLGITREELDGSVWADVLHSHLGGTPPLVDFGLENLLAETLHAAALQGIVTSAHDLSAGGLIQSLTEAVLRRGVGARVWLGEICERDGIDLASALFSESQARVIVSVAREDDVKFQGLCRGRNVPVARVGVTDLVGQALDISDVGRFSSEELTALHTSGLPARFGPVVGGSVGA